MPASVESAHEVIIVYYSIFTDRFPKIIRTQRFLQAFAVIGDDVIVERDVVGKYEILVLVIRVCVRHHIGEVGKMLGGLNPEGIIRGTVATAKRRFRLRCRITPRVSRKTYTLPSRHKQQGEGHNDKM